MPAILNGFVSKQAQNSTLDAAIFENVLVASPCLCDFILSNSRLELNWTELNFIDNNIYIITKLLAPATSKMTNRGGGKGYTLTTREK